MTKTIKLKINPCKEREELLKNLALSGYKTWQEEVIRDKCIPSKGHDYYVCFEVDESEISHSDIDQHVDLITAVSGIMQTLRDENNTYETDTTIMIEELGKLGYTFQKH
jgi:hypothetical protein